MFIKVIITLNSQFPTFNSRLYYNLTTDFTPFTVRSFFSSDSSFPVSSTSTSRFPLNSPSWLSIFIDFITIFSSFDMMLVMLLTIPKSSLPTIRSVMLYCDAPFPLQRAFTIR